MTATDSLSSPFFTHHWTTDLSGIVPFTLAVLCYYFCRRCFVSTVTLAHQDMFIILKLEHIKEPSQLGFPASLQGLLDTAVKLLAPLCHNWQAGKHTHIICYHYTVPGNRFNDKCTTMQFVLSSAHPTNMGVFICRLKLQCHLSNTQ